MSFNVRFNYGTSSRSAKSVQQIYVMGEMCINLLVYKTKQYVKVGIDYTDNYLWNDRMESILF